MNSQVYLQAIANDSENTLRAEVSVHRDMQGVELSVRSTATDERQKVEVKVSSEANKERGIDTEDEGYSMRWRKMRTKKGEVRSGTAGTS